MRAITAVLSVCLLAGIASADTVSWTDQGVTFDLTVNDLGAMVTATLDVQSDTTGDFLKYVGFKIFSGDPPAFQDGALTAHPGGYTFIAGSRNGGDGSIQGTGTGFVGADHSGNGPAMDGTKYSFHFKWNTTVDPFDGGYSIKAWTALANGRKSRQWSSGPLEQIPEPAALLLIACGAAFAVRRRR